MPLFEVPKRAGKSQDKKVIQKAKSTVKSNKIVKGGATNLLTRISIIKSEVESKLGQYKDDYIIIDTVEALQDYIQACIKNRVCAIDTETMGLDPLLDNIVGMSIFTPEQPAAYIPINHVSYITGIRADGQLTEKEICVEFEPLIKEHIDIVMFNAVFDMRVLRHAGMKDIYCTWDCYLAAKIMNENEPENGLKALHKKYILQGKGDAFSFDALFKGMTFDKVPIKIGYIYAAHDAIITYEYYEYQKKFVYYDPSSQPEDRNGMNGASWVFFNIEMPVVPIVADMEDTGVLLDLEYQEELSVKYNKLLEDKLNECHVEISKYRDKIDKYKVKHPDKKLDDPINIASPVQLAILFYDILECKVVDKNSPRGTGEEILSKMDNPIAKLVLEFRSLSKLVETYIDKLPDCVNPNDGRVHCKFNQYGARTGRFSSQDPNLQNIPSHNKDIRKMFIATNNEFSVDVIDDKICVDKWDEIMTELGWMCANNVKVGDAVEIEIDGKFDLQTVKQIKFDNQSLIFYF